MNVFNTLTFNQIFWKTKPFSKNRSTVFQLKALRLTYKTAISKTNVRQMVWRVQNSPITKNGVLLVTT